MPTNNFKLFDENKANLLTDTEYGNSTQRLNGVQTGVASSQLNNKFAYQVSLVAYAIAQLMNANGLDASDTLAVSAFVGNLQGAILQKVADKATSAEAAAGVLSNKYITPETMKAAALLLSGGVMNGILDMGNNRITNLGTPTADSDAVTKGYVDGNLPYDYISAFNVPKEINIYMQSSGGTKYGTGTVKNYLGYSIVEMNVTNGIGSGTEYVTKKSFGGDFLKAGIYNISGTIYSIIRSGPVSIDYYYGQISSDGKLGYRAYTVGIYKQVFNCNFI